MQMTHSNMYQPVSTASSDNQYTINMSEIGSNASDISRHPGPVQFNLTRPRDGGSSSQRGGLNHSMSALEMRPPPDNSDLRQRANTTPTPSVQTSENHLSSAESSRTPSPYQGAGIPLLPLHNISERSELSEYDQNGSMLPSDHNRSMTPTFNRPSKVSHRRVKSGDSNTSWGPSISLDQGLRGSYENLRRDGYEWHAGRPTRADSERRSSTGTICEDHNNLMYGVGSQQSQLHSGGNTMNAKAPPWTPGEGYFVPSDDLDPSMHSQHPIMRTPRVDNMGRPASGNGSPSYNMNAAPFYLQGSASSLAHSMSQQQMAEQLMFMETAHIETQNRLLNDLRKELRSFMEAVANKEREVHNKENEFNKNDTDGDSNPNERTIQNLKEEVSVLTAELSQMFHELDTLGVPIKGDPQPSIQHEQRPVLPVRTTQQPKRRSLPSPNNNNTTNHHYERSTSVDTFAATGDYVMLAPLPGMPSNRPNQWTLPTEPRYVNPITTQPSRPVRPIYENTRPDPRIPPPPHAGALDLPPPYMEVAGASPQQMNPAQRQINLQGFDNNNESSSDENEYWNCPKCTFQNLLVHECEACDAPRPI